jgi:hypothetical protein
MTWLSEAPLARGRLLLAAGCDGKHGEPVKDLFEDQTLHQLACFALCLGRTVELYAALMVGGAGARDKWTCIIFVSYTISGALWQGLPQLAKACLLQLSNYRHAPCEA